MTIIVGVDGSQSAMEAVVLAVREAAWRDSPLRIVHAFGWALAPVPVGPSPEGPPDGGLRHDAERILSEAAALAADTEPKVEVTTDLIDGVPSPVLLGCAQSAQLVVLGSRGLGGFTGLLLGSVAVHLAAHSPVPVLVARGTMRRSGPVVVGVDGSVESASALEWAVREAQLRETELVALRAWTGPQPLGPGDALPPVLDVQAAQTGEEQLLGEALEAHDGTGLQVRRMVRHDRPARALVQLSEQAQLVVVGTRGRGGFAGLLLGSTSHQLLHHADCPVMVVPRKA